MFEMYQVDMDRLVVGKTATKGDVGCLEVVDLGDYGPFFEGHLGATLSSTVTGQGSERHLD
jgi:hypothetical protein